MQFKGPAALQGSARSARGEPVLAAGGKIRTEGFGPGPIRELSGCIGRGLAVWSCVPAQWHNQAYGRKGNRLALPVQGPLTLGDSIRH